MTNLLTPSGEIDGVAVQREAMRRSVAQRNRDWDRGLASSLGKLFLTQKEAVLRAAERDRDEAANRVRKLGMSLREAAILETSLRLERARHGMAMPYDKAEVDRLSAKLAELRAEEAIRLQAAE